MATRTTTRRRPRVTAEQAIRGALEGGDGARAFDLAKDALMTALAHRRGADPASAAVESAELAALLLATAEQLPTRPPRDGHPVSVFSAALAAARTRR